MLALSTTLIEANWTLSLSVLTAIFPHEPGLAGFIEDKDDGSGGDNCIYKSCKAPVKSSPPTNQHPPFYRPDALPVAQPMLSKPEGKISHFVDLHTPTSPGVFKLCLWPLIAPGFVKGGLSCLSSALWCQYPKLEYWWTEDKTCEWQQLHWQLLLHLKLPLSEEMQLLIPVLQTFTVI